MRKCEKVDDDGDKTKKNASSDNGPLGFSMICKRKDTWSIKINEGGLDTNLDCL